MKYKKTILSMGIAVLAILYGIYKFSPVISQSLENEGFKLISNAQNKEEIYKRILDRYKDDINKDIKLDEYLIAKDQKWVALSFWCDVETSGKRIFINLDNHKKYCTMGVVDYLMDGKLKGEVNVKYVSRIFFFDNRQKYEELFKSKNIEWKEKPYLSWIRWCRLQKYLKNDKLNLDIVDKWCLGKSIIHS